MILRLTYRESVTEWKDDGTDRVGYTSIKIRTKDYDTDKLGRDWVEKLNTDLAKWGNRVLHNNNLTTQQHVVFLCLHDLDTLDDYTRYIMLEEA